MKSQARKLLAAFCMTALLIISNHQLSTAFAQGTAFTYQGQLQDNGAVANGTFNLKFTLFDTNINGTAVAGPVTNSDVAISNGLFTVTIDFGAVWNGETNWLEIGVETNGSSLFTTLSPRQRVTPTPYAIAAENLNGTVGSSGLSGTYGGMVTLNNPANQFTGAFTGDGTGLTNVNAIALGGLSASSFWQLGGNTAGSGSQIVGTLNNQPFDLYADGVRAMRLVLRTGGQYSNAPNIIGGSSVNLVKASVVGGTVGGGGGVGTNGISYPNQVNANFGTISGGSSNDVSSAGVYAFIGGGQGNSAEQGLATIGGGFENIANNAYATIGGGYQNTASGPGATMGGGGLNISSGLYSTVAGGLNNSASGTNAGYATVGGGDSNVVTGDYSTIGGGIENVVTGAGSVVGGGGIFPGFVVPNEVDGDAGVIGGGTGNYINTNATWAFIGGGASSQALSNYVTIGGGSLHFATGESATIAGGYQNVALGAGSFIGGGGEDGVSYDGNVVDANAASIVGGMNNAILPGARYASIGGGAYNTNSGLAASISGGYGNIASGIYSMVPGGLDSHAVGAYSFAAGDVATAQHNGSFVWNDTSALTVSDTGANEFVISATGGFYFYTSTAAIGAQLGPGATSWTTLSDRNAKKNFQPVDTVAVLNKLAAIPIEQWNYKWEGDADTPNIGPMAQDFKAAFYPGRDDKGISTLEFDGVELAAIQGLNEKVEGRSQKEEGQIEELKTENAELKEKNDSLEKRLEALEQIVCKQKSE